MGPASGVFAAMDVAAMDVVDAASGDFFHSSSGMMKGISEDERVKLGFLDMAALYRHYDSNPLLVDSWLKEAGLSVSCRVHLFDNFDNNVNKMRKIHHEAWFRTLYYVPGINFFVEIFFDETPPLDSIKVILELMGVMGALLFSLIVSVVVSIDYDRYEQAKERWDTGVYSNCFRDVKWPNGISPGQGMIEWFANHIYEAMRASFCSFILVIFIYMLLYSSNLDSKEERDVWWMWIKWTVLLSLVLIVLALVDLFLALQNLLEWSFPNQDFVEKHGCDNAVILHESNNIWGWNTANTSAVMGSVCGLFILLASGAIIAKLRVSDERKILAL